MAHINKFVNAAENNWSVDKTATSTTFFRTGYTPGDGYPHTVVVAHSKAGVVSGGQVLTDYGAHDMGEGPYELGSRNTLKVIENANSPFRYKRFLEAWMARSPASTSEKHLAQSLSISERQVRNARIMGFMDDYLADKLSCKVLGVHPSNLFGTPEWLADGLKLNVVE